MVDLLWGGLISGVKTPLDPTISRLGVIRANHSAIAPRHFGRIKWLALMHKFVDIHNQLPDRFYFISFIVLCRLLSYFALQKHMSER